MRFTATPLNGAFILDLELREDSRGYFGRTFCRREFEAHGIQFDPVQANVAFTKHAGTFRGLHYQTVPSREGKLFRCIAGAIYDVILDMRPESPTYLQCFGIELTAENMRGLYVPPQFAHGYQSLVDDCAVTYIVSDYYAPQLEAGLRYDDPGLDITLPLPVSEISDKDTKWPVMSTKGRLEKLVLKNHDNH